MVEKSDTGWEWRTACSEATDKSMCGVEHLDTGN
jgi:hypothetical protein